VRDDSILTTSSGALLPNATTVKPTTYVEIFRAIAIRNAPLSSSSAPMIKSIRPVKNRMLIINGKSLKMR